MMGASLFCKDKFKIVFESCGNKYNTLRAVFIVFIYFLTFEIILRFQLQAIREPYYLRRS